MPASKKLKVTALAGGVGASKLLLGLYEVMDSRDLTIIVNTGDDIVLHGLKISPDLDIVTYTLAGIVDSAKGWGFCGETFHALKRLAHFGRANWLISAIAISPRNIHRTAMLAEGKTCRRLPESIRIALGVKSRILLMSDDPVPTIIDSNEGPCIFRNIQKRRAVPSAAASCFVGVESARPAPGVLEAIATRRPYHHLPQQPLISIGPVLAVSKSAKVACTQTKSIRFRPIVGGKPQRPSDKMLAQLATTPLPRRSEIFTPSSLAPSSSTPPTIVLQISAPGIKSPSSRRS
jgi:LPPG:FO 2-phospho-L-lactate transferase